MKNTNASRASSEQPSSSPTPHGAVTGEEAGNVLPSAEDYDRSIHSNPDAQAWAQFFIKTVKKIAPRIVREQNYRSETVAIGYLATDEGYMIGWFANAMMAMHDHIKAQPVSADGQGQVASHPPLGETRKEGEASCTAAETISRQTTVAGNAAPKGSTPAAAATSSSPSGPREAQEWSDKDRMDWLAKQQVEVRNEKTRELCFLTWPAKECDLRKAIDASLGVRPEVQEEKEKTDL